jgi:hypothetical protein
MLLIGCHIQSDRSLVNVHDPSEDKSDDTKDSFMMNWSRLFITFPNTLLKFSWEILMKIWGEVIFSHRQLRMRICIRIVMIMASEY